MARYTYNAGLVTQTIDTLYTACDYLDNTNVDMKKGIDMIFNARGAENMNIDFSPITGYQSTVVEHIETMANELQKKAQEIEEYQDAPWYKKLFATVGMGALKLVEGLASFVENIGDGLVSIVGFVGGVFSSEFKNSVAEFVRTDYVGETTSKWYEEGWLKDVNKYSVMSHQSTAANVLKGIGTATGYVILTVATGGAGAAVSTGVAAGAAAVGGIGSGTQNALKQAQLTNPELTAGEAFNSAFGQGVKQGAIAAGTTLLTAGIAKGIQNIGAGNAFATFADKIDDATLLGKAAHGAQNILNSGAQKVMGTTIGSKLVNGASKVLTGAGNLLDDAAYAIGTNPAVPNFVTNAAQNLVNAGGAAIAANAVGSVAGATAGGQFKKNTESAAIDQYIQEVQNPSVAQNLYEETQGVLAGENAIPGVATSEEAAQNLQNLQAQGYNTGTDTATDPGADTQSTGGETSTGGNYSGGSGGSSYTVNADPVDVPDYPGSTQGNNAVSPLQPPSQQPPSLPEPPEPPQTPESLQPSPPPTSQNDIVSNINPGVSSNNGVNGGNSGNGGGSALHVSTGQNNIGESAKGTVSSEVLNTFGDVSGSFAEISGNKTSIPTSSSPILSSTDGQKSASTFVPLGAGLGAASIAGIGAKAYMDKRENSKETESNEIETEEWAENDNVEIDYGVETTEEADYLSPSDELAFTE